MVSMRVACCHHSMLARHACMHATSYYLLRSKLGSPCTQHPLLQTQYFLLHNRLAHHLDQDEQ